MDTNERVNEVVSLFRSGGALQKAMPGFEARDPQLQMVEIITRCMAESRNGIIQAAVGTGKSLGYGVPAAVHAVTQNKRVIISTNTKDLQRQLMEQDLPLIQKILAMEGHELIFSEAKGQSNYLCIKKLNELHDLEPDSEILQSILNEIKQNPAMNGDRNSFPFEIPIDTWKLVEADSSECLSKNNPYGSSCFALRSRNKFFNSHVIVSNHAMFFSDLSGRSQGLGIFPDYDVVIFDEAHRIEDVYAQFWKKEITLERIEKTFHSLKTRKASWMKGILQGHVLTTWLEYRNQILNTVDGFLKAIQRQMTDGELETLILSEPITTMKNPVLGWYSELIDWLKLLPYKLDAEDDAKKGIFGLRMRYLHDLELLLFMFMMHNPDEWAFWIQLREDKNPARQVVYNSVPYEPKTALAFLYTYATVIFASGTIAPAGDFEYAANRFGIQDYLKLDVKSPFHYYKQALLIIPDQEGDHTHYDRWEQRLKEILSITKGSTFVLFTSFEAIRETHKRLNSWMDDEGLELFIQAPGTNRDKLLEAFILSDRGVLFGAESFWEGINIPGDDLRCVVITQIKFPNPSDPFIKAKMLKLEREGKNSFKEYSLKVAIMSMNQGTGRLLRKSTDRGAVIILDPRIHTKRYGDTILRALPNFKRSSNIQDIQRFF
jgi:ATP-dependent DNA helicase DinG